MAEEQQLLARLVRLLGERPELTDLFGLVADLVEEPVDTPRPALHALAVELSRRRHATDDMVEVEMEPDIVDAAESVARQRGRTTTEQLDLWIRLGMAAGAAPVVEDDLDEDEVHTAEHEA